MENYGKKWEIEEEKKLISEINDLLEIDIIIKNHKRSITGIKSRIEKIFSNNLLSKEIKDKNKIILKYFNDDSKYNNIKFTTYQEDILLNLLNYYSFDDLKKKYDKLSTDQIITILKNLQKYENLEVYKKVRISNIINNFEENNIELPKDNIKKSKKNKSKKNDINIEDSDEINENSEILNILKNISNEIKIMHADIFDLKNRVNSILNKIK